MLKHEKSQYLNSIFQLNYMKYDKKLSYQIVYYKNFNFKKYYSKSKIQVSTL